MAKALSAGQPAGCHLGLPVGTAARGVGISLPAALQGAPRGQDVLVNAIGMSGPLSGSCGRISTDVEGQPPLNRVSAAGKEESLLSYQRPHGLALDEDVRTPEAAFAPGGAGVPLRPWEEPWYQLSQMPGV